MSAKNLFLITVALFASVFFLSSCETQTSLRSEKKLNEQIQAHPWKLVTFKANQAQEDWSFSNGNVYRTIYNDVVPARDTGNYSIDAKLSYSYLTISNYQRTLDKMNARWTIIELTEDQLFIAYKDPASGLSQLEFVK